MDREKPKQVDNPGLKYLANTTAIFIEDATSLPLYAWDYLETMLQGGWEPERIGINMILYRRKKDDEASRCDRDDKVGQESAGTTPSPLQAVDGGDGASSPTDGAKEGRDIL